MAQPPPAIGGRVSRRDFLKLMAAAGTVMTFAPFVDWGKFLPNPASNEGQRVKAELRMARLSTLIPFLLIIPRLSFTKSDDAALNKEAFRTWQLIRLQELGGDKNDASAFRAFSMVCLHLWCLWKYWPEEGRKRGECPCHGSMYDPTTGQAFAGPALQDRQNVPYLGLEIDSNGDILILPPTWDPNANGIVGYGRYLNVWK